MHLTLVSCHAQAPYEHRCAFMPLTLNLAWNTSQVFGPRLNNCALVFNVWVMLLMWCDVHVHSVNEDRLRLWHVHLVCFDCSCTALTYQCRKAELLKSLVKNNIQPEVWVLFCWASHKECKHFSAAANDYFHYELTCRLFSVLFILSTKMLKNCGKIPLTIFHNLKFPHQIVSFWPTVINKS